MKNEKKKRKDKRNKSAMSSAGELFCARGFCVYTRIYSGTDTKQTTINSRIHTKSECSASLSSPSSLSM